MTSKSILCTQLLLDSSIWKKNFVEMEIWNVKSFYFNENINNFTN